MVLGLAGEEPVFLNLCASQLSLTQALKNTNSVFKIPDLAESLYSFY